MHTGELNRNSDFEKRYKASLCPVDGNNHNWLRIWRILAHLNVVGFRRYAKQLVKFLEKEIYGYEGYYLKIKCGNSQFNTIYCPLKILRSYEIKTMKNWWLYGDIPSEY